ncbi:hypothetical protein ABZ342_25755 [Amycolatopsis sp. NPDC005961]|uniref:T4 family baseplate hub assembly chaperone n=1 Tax=Amycolatopsis sp. NPDC005961 TaxID=3156720 RepID=UPI0033CCC530
MNLLPGGYRDAGGVLHREFELAPLTGREEELLAHRSAAPTAALVTDVLSRCVARLGAISPVTQDVTRHLLVADRLYLLLRLRQATFGDVVRAALTCPWAECGEQMSVDFSIADVPVDEQPDRAPQYAMTLSGGTEVAFRLPTGADQELLSERLAANEAEALTALLSRCVLRIGDRPPDPDRVAALPAAARLEIEDRMRELAPKVEQTLAARCAECGRTFVAPFDVHRFFFGELRTDATVLYQEVHYLAYHYHWSESEIMAMTRDKRHTYIDVLADTIEVLNSGA